MNEKKILESIQDIFRDVFNDEDLFIGKDTGAPDIEGWDSLMHITILEAVADEYEIAFTLDEMAGMKTAGDMVEWVVRKTGGD